MNIKFDILSLINSVMELNKRQISLEIAQFIHYCTTSIENENLWSKHIAMYMYSISVYYQARTQPI